jgi:uncharacterized protein
MAIEIRESFQVKAPIETVWRLFMDPQRVVTCMPGAELEEVVDERTFVGKVKVKVGAVTSSYKGKVRFTEIDESGHRLQMVGEGKETSGGTAKGTMTATLRALPDGQTEVVAEANVDLTGRIMQVGRGMIQGVSKQIFQQFAARAKQILEAEPAAPGAAPVPLPDNAPVKILPIILKALWEAILGFFRRLFGGKSS